MLLNFRVAYLSVPHRISRGVPTQSSAPECRQSYGCKVAEANHLLKIIKILRPNQRELYPYVMLKKLLVSPMIKLYLL